MKYTKKSGLALIPFLVFIVVYLGAGLIYQAKGEAMAFYMFPSVTAMFFAVIVAFAMSKGSINERFETFAKGAANVDVLTMLIIYILAGAFATVAANMGAKDATVNLGLSLVPPSLLAAGLFIIAAFFGTATGTADRGPLDLASGHGFNTGAKDAEGNVVGSRALRYVYSLTRK